MLKYSVNRLALSSSQQKVADVNGDRVINTTDALQILRFGVGKTKMTLATAFVEKYQDSLYQSALQLNQTQQMLSTQIIQVEEKTLVSTLIKEIQAGKTGEDVYEVSAVMCRKLARRNLLVDLGEIPNLTARLYKKLIPRGQPLGIFLGVRKKTIDK